jgi:hypothetical protein
VPSPYSDGQARVFPTASLFLSFLRASHPYSQNLSQAANKYLNRKLPYPKSTDAAPAIKSFIHLPIEEVHF